MIRLIKNELFKIFHKKGIYIIFIITMALAVFFSFLITMEMPDALDSQVLQMNQQTLASYENGEVEYDEYYVQIKAQVDEYNLRHEKDIYNKSTSPEYYYIVSEIGPLYESYYSLKYLSKDDAAAAEQKKLVDEAIDTLHNFDWKKLVEEEIKELEESKKLVSSEDEMMNTMNTINTQIEVLKYRLDNDIPYSFNNASTELAGYLTNINNYNSIEHDESKIPTRSELNQKRSYESSIAETKYMMEHKLLKNDTEQTSAASTFVTDMCSISMITVICIVLVSSAVVADEFNKGTIKQLLIRPFSRTKIIVSKLIASFVTILAFIVLTAIGESLIIGLINGSLGSLFEPVLLYNFNTHSIMEFNVITAGFLKFACVLPEVMIIILITFFASTLFTNNGISTAIGIITFFASTIFSLYVDLHVLVSYIPLVNWDFNSYLFGALPNCKYLTLTKSIVVSVVTVIALFIATLVIYKRKDIKNQ